MPVIQYREALKQAMAEEMARDPSVFLMGEEVGYYQGAYKVSQGLLEQFGKERVIDTPIAETGFTGLGIGAAMVGLRPIVELMTWNFSLVCYDQLVNHAAKIRYMSSGQYKCPIVFRGPTGAAHMLSAQHSQSLEAIYAHIPGLKVVSVATPYDAKGLLKSAIRDDDPVVFMESELLYGTSGEVPEGEYTIPLGLADVKREGKDVTVVTWNKQLFTCLKAADALAADGIEAEVIDLRTIRPLDAATVLASVKKTNRVVVVQEGWPYCGVAAEICYQIQEAVFDYLDAPVRRVTNLDVPMPYAHNLEERVLPSAERVIEAVKAVCYV
jgi:pyruvate/2-oxoglutarate/acetoin dehydrogenase E1 component